MSENDANVRGVGGAPANRADTENLIAKASLLRAWDFEELRPEARVAALLLPDLISSSLAPTTRYSYELHYSKIFVWC